MPQEMMPLVYEHILASEYGWDEEKIAKLDYSKALEHVQMCLTRENLRREFEMEIAGIKLQKKGIM